MQDISGGDKMKRHGNALRCIAAAVAVALAAFSVFSDTLRAPFIYISDKAAVAAAMIPKFTAADKAPTKTKAAAKPDTAQAEKQAPTTVPTSAPTTAVKAVLSGAKGKIKKQTIGFSGATNVQNLHIANKTGVEIDAAKQIKIKPNFKIVKGDKPQVLIMHTHATECFYPTESDVYLESWATRTTDSKKNTLALGQIITDELNAAGIKSIHDTTQHDAEAYSGSYERARKTIKSYLEKYPSIDVVLDIHRDAITYDDGTKLCPTVEVNGSKAAQIMIATGCNSGSVTEHRNWIENFRFAIRLQQSCEQKYGKFARPLYFVSKKYNHDLTYGSLLVEVGSEANTLEQAKYSALLLARALIPVLEGLQ